MTEPRTPMTPLDEERAVAFREGDSLEVELGLEHSHLFALDTGTAIR